LLVGWLATLLWGDPVDLGGWRIPLGWALVLLFVGWNGWSLWLFARHRTGLLALYLGLALLAPTFAGSRCSRPRCCSSAGARSALGNGSFASGSERRTTTTRGGCVAGSERWT
jgi:hypothetical protein